MNISWRQILAPFVGALAGFLAGKGLSLTPDQIDIATGLLGGAAAAGVHVLEVWMAKSSTTLPPPTAGVNRTLPKAWLLLPLLLPLLKLLCTLALVAALAACASSPVQSTDEGLYAAYGLYGTVEQLLAEGVTQGWLAKSNAIAIDAKAATARTLLDTAKSLESSPGSAASMAQDLSTAAAVLQALDTQLMGMQPHSGSPAQPRGP